MDQTPTLALRLREDDHCLILFDNMERAMTAPASSPDEMIIIHTLNHAYGTNGAARLAEYLHDEYLANDILPDRLKDTYTEFAARVLRNNFLLPLRNKGRLPDGVFHTIVSRARGKQFAIDVLARDKSHCIVTGRPDRRATNPLLPPANMECAHVAPFAPLRRKEVADLVEVFTGGEITPDDIESELDTVKNGMLLQHDVHRDFDEYLWSIEIGADERYRIVHFNDGPKLSFLETATHLNLDLELLSNPAARYCKLHCTMAGLLRATGFKATVEPLPSDPNRMGTRAMEIE